MRSINTCNAYNQKYTVISYQQKQHIALIIAILFHVSGVIGILFSRYKIWFISLTPLNLFLMATLLIITQKDKNISFFGFIFLCCLTGISTEIIGVNTAYLFGNYNYGNLLGPKLLGVPWLIGINWFICVFCAGIIVFKLNEWVYKKLSPDLTPSLAVRLFTFVFDAAFLTTVFDFILEPPATKLGLWTWLPNGKIPVYNFVCWFIISAILLTFFWLLKFDKHNQFAVHLFIIQVLFFLVLQTFL